MECKCTDKNPFYKCTMHNSTIFSFNRALFLCRSTLLFTIFLYLDFQPMILHFVSYFIINMRLNLSRFFFTVRICVYVFVVLQVFFANEIFSNKIYMQSIWVISEWPISMQRPQEKTFLFSCFYFASHDFRLANSQFSRQPIRLNDRIAVG